MTSTRWIAVAIASVAACGDNRPGPSTETPDAPSGDPTRPPNVALCYTPQATGHPAAVMFLGALRAGDRDARAAAITALDGAVQALPDEEALQLYLGLAHLWRLAEPLPGEDAPLSQLSDATAARDHLRLAYQLCPTDQRVPAWLGPVLVRFGRALGDQRQVDEGLTILDQGIAAYPGFVLFSKLLVYADAARDSADFQNALAAVNANITACEQTPNDPACTNATVPHNREGGGLFLGDVRTKGLQRDGAATAYASAMAGPDFASWPFQSVITDRMQHLDERIALYGNASTSDDPAAAWTATNQCALCHQQ